MPSRSASPGQIERHPVLTLRDIVVFPCMTVPLFVGRDSSVRAVRAAVKAERPILLATQKAAQDDEPGIDAIHMTGTLASALQVLDLPDHTIKVLVEGRSRARVHRYHKTDFYEADAETFASEMDASEASARSLVAAFEAYVRLNRNVSPEVVTQVARMQDHSRLADTVAAHLAARVADKQAVLETVSVAARLERCLALIESEVSILRGERTRRGVER